VDSNEPATGSANTTYLFDDLLGIAHGETLGLFLAAEDLVHLQALGIFRDLGDRGGEATALNERGTLHRVSGDLAEAEGCHQQVLELAHAIDSSWDEAHALAGLGRCALASDRATKAEALLRQALEIFQRIGAAEAAYVSVELDALTEAEPAAPGS